MTNREKHTHPRVPNGARGAVRDVRGQQQPTYIVFFSLVCGKALAKKQQKHPNNLFSPYVATPFLPYVKT